MNILRNTTDVYKPYWHVSWCSLYKVYMMFGYSHCNTDEHFKVPVFWEILPLSEQNRMIKTPSPSTKF